LKLIDFGSAEVFDPMKAKQLGIVLQNVELEEKGYIGSKHYISPEMIKRSQARQQSQETVDYYSKTDLWSLGISSYT
jgi:serine/threonine protein kinase